MSEKRTPLQRRIAPGISFTLEYPDETLSFRLAFNNNALANVEERCGLNLLANPYALWADLGKSRLGVMFWAALLQDRPELDSDEGLRIVRSYLDGPENELRAFNAVWDAYMLYLPKEQAESLRKSREDWEKRQKSETGEIENPPKPAANIPQEVRATPAKAPEPSPSTGSSSGPSPDSISDLPTAISAS